MNGGHHVHYACRAEQHAIKDPAGKAAHLPPRFDDLTGGRQRNQKSDVVLPFCNCVHFPQSIQHFIAAIAPIVHAALLHYVPLNHPLFIIGFGLPGNYPGLFD
jgi:hypothetical protein